MNRREFLKGTAWMGAAAMAAGCQLNRFGFGEGGQMQNFAFRKLMGKRIRVGFIGIGGRGSGAVHRVSMIPGVDIVALCDLRQEQVDSNLAWLREQKYAGVDKIKTYVGAEAYKELCDFGACDVVYCATPIKHNKKDDRHLTVIFFLFKIKCIPAAILTIDRACDTDKTQILPR